MQLPQQLQMQVYLKCYLALSHGLATNRLTVITPVAMLTNKACILASTIPFVVSLFFWDLGLLALPRNVK